MQVSSSSWPPPPFPFFSSALLSLAIHSHPGLSSDILEGVRAVWESTPDHLRYDRNSADSVDHNGWLTILYLYLNYLYTCFLIQRALIKHTNTGQEALCDISRQVLSMVNSMTTRRSAMVDLDRHYSWIVGTLHPLHPLPPSSHIYFYVFLFLETPCDSIANLWTSSGPDIWSS